MGRQIQIEYLELKVRRHKYSEYLLRAHSFRDPTTCG